MKHEQIRQAVRTLFERGKKKKEIARFLRIDVKTVRSILDREPGTAENRSDKILVDYDVLKNLYAECDGYAQRMHEILTEERKIPIGYSTLTRLLREYGIGERHEQRSHRYPDIPGEEMQHDTSMYFVKLGETRRKLICSGLYLRYSKMRYITFYPHFDRFRMKCFIHEALRFLGYTAKICIIDNTNLAVLYGTGERAVFHPEMIAFAENYGFQWKAHRIRHANRKAGKERNFFTLETNFFPGRTFRDLEDLNRKAFQWATERFASRPQAKTRLIPSELFEQEKPYLVKLPAYIEAPYREHKRDIDQYGYVALDGNFYWVPEKVHGKLTVIEYDTSISIYHTQRKLQDYPLPPDGVKNQPFAPPGVTPPHHAPRNRKHGCKEEEKQLRQLGPVSGAYVDYIQSTACKIRYKPKFIRELHGLMKKISKLLFLKTAERALHYHIDSIASVERIAEQLVRNEVRQLPEVPLPDRYESRNSYQEGRFSAEADPKRYNELMEEDEDG